MIREIGCNNDGSVWISIIFEVEKKPYTVICPMDNKKAKEVHAALGKAIEQGDEWKKTGKRPNI